jgi:hypothetical protein
LQRQHGIVMDARFLDLRKLGQEEAEVHEISPSVLANAVLRKPADAESSALCAWPRTSTRFPQVKGKVRCIWDNSHCPA